MANRGKILNFVMTRNRPDQGCPRLRCHWHTHLVSAVCGIWGLGFRSCNRDNVAAGNLEGNFERPWKIFKRPMVSRACGSLFASPVGRQTLRQLTAAESALTATMQQDSMAGSFEFANHGPLSFPFSSPKKMCNFNAGRLFADPFRAS